MKTKFSLGTKFLNILLQVHTTNFVSFYPTNSPGQLEKQANYQTSKNVVNAPANKIIYGQTQVS